jgi:hypothetical protein
MWKSWLLCTAIIALPAVVDAQVQEAQQKPKPAGTDLRIHVTGGDEAMPVKGATVYLEWKEDGETRNREGVTNAEGLAGPYRLPRVTVFVQITTSDEVWETYGKDHSLTTEQETIAVTLKKKHSTLCRLDWMPVHRHNLATADFPAHFAEKATVRPPGVGHRQNVGGRIAFWRCSGTSPQADVHVELRSQARCNQVRSVGLPFVAVVQTADFGSHHDTAGRLDEYAT